MMMLMTEAVTDGQTHNHNLSWPNVHALWETRGGCRKVEKIKKPKNRTLKARAENKFADCEIFGCWFDENSFHHDVCALLLTPPVRNFILSCRYRLYLSYLEPVSVERWLRGAHWCSGILRCALLHPTSGFREWLHGWRVCLNPSGRVCWSIHKFCHEVRHCFYFVLWVYCVLLFLLLLILINGDGDGGHRKISEVLSMVMLIACFHSWLLVCKLWHCFWCSQRELNLCNSRL